MTPTKQNRLLSILLVVFGLIMSSATNVFAYDEHGKFLAWGDGSCGQLTEELKTGQGAATVNKMYIQGFVAGINASVPGNVDFFAGSDMDSRFNFVAKYCEENPLSYVIGGLAEMVRKITGKDMQHLAPQPFQKPKHGM
ncbi:hypothetical protein [Sulfurirhabdus autotrophica]|uniref:Rap1a immunity protein domain-containing protein n=1 Tax=Sulfurirhabdus autotrophica TaxID=1706046 RepID=A0A4R3Y2T2_9PROT|nr:hypothetical protein [Sulfurirhabdus autotrophica]TCV85887.1 hypothetical protein EDC63_10895 [Sulfurirhabdus autotrophica]